MANGAVPVIGHPPVSPTVSPILFDCCIKQVLILELNPQDSDVMHRKSDHFYVYSVVYFQYYFIFHNSFDTVFVF